MLPEYRLSTCAVSWTHVGFNTDPPIGCSLVLSVIQPRPMAQPSHKQYDIELVFNTIIYIFTCHWPFSVPALLTASVHCQQCCYCPTTKGVMGDNWNISFGEVQTELYTKGKVKLKLSLSTSGRRIEEWRQNTTHSLPRQ